MITVKLKNYTPNQVHYLLHRMYDIYEELDCQVNYENLHTTRCESCANKEVCRDLENLVFFLENEVRENYPHCKNK